MVDISRKTSEINGIGKLVDNGGTLWLNKTHIKKD